MKKILLCVSLLAVFAAGFAGCSQRREWNREERKAMRDALRSYPEIVQQIGVQVHRIGAVHPHRLAACAATGR